MATVSEKVMVEPRILPPRRDGKPPGPKAQGILAGHFRQFRRDPLAFLCQVARDYGDLASLRFGWKTLVLVSHPDLVEQVLVTHNRKLIKHFALRMAKPTLGDGLLTSEGEFWRRQRRLAQPAFHRQRIADYADQMVASADEMLDRWQDGQRRDLDAEMMQVTLQIAARTLFGADLGEKAVHVSTHMEVLMQNFSDRVQRLIPSISGIMAMLRSRRGCSNALSAIDNLLQEIIDQRRRQTEPGDDLLSMLLQARDAEDGSAMTDGQLRDEVMTLFAAGHETTAMTMMWAFWLLGRHPEAEARLHDELDQILEQGRLPGLGDLEHLPYTAAVIDETLRHHSTVWLIGREVIEPFSLGGYHFEQGTTLYVSPWVLQRDPRFFEDPDQFRPERWLDGTLAKRLPRYAYFPFGGGPRICIGNNFALMEARLLLAAIARRYRLLLDPGFTPELWPTMTLRSQNRIPVTLQARE